MHSQSFLQGFIAAAALVAEVGAKPAPCKAPTSSTGLPSASATTAISLSSSETSIALDVATSSATASGSSSTTATPATSVDATTLVESMASSTGSSTRTTVVTVSTTLATKISSSTAITSSEAITSSASALSSTTAISSAISATASSTSSISMTSSAFSRTTASSTLSKSSTTTTTTTTTTQAALPPLQTFTLRAANTPDTDYDGLVVQASSNYDSYLWTRLDSVQLGYGDGHFHIDPISKLLISGDYNLLMIGSSGKLQIFDGLSSNYRVVCDAGAPQRGVPLQCRPQYFTGPYWQFHTGYIAGQGMYLSLLDPQDKTSDPASVTIDLVPHD